MNGDGLSLIGGEKSKLSFAGKNGGWGWVYAESRYGGLVGLVSLVGFCNLLLSITRFPEGDPAIL